MKKSTVIGLTAALVLLALLTLATPAAAQTTFAWTGSYYANPSLQGEPVLVRDDANIDFDWGTASPGNGLPAENFSVRWTRWLYIDTPGPWTLTTITDDGVRLFVDDNLTIDAWYDQPLAVHTAKVNLTRAYHLVRLEYYQHDGNASVHLSANSASYPDWRGEYYDNPDLTGAPKFVRNDTTINFDFGEAGPGGGIAGTNFSVRWTGSPYFDAGKYRFTITADDGVRLWIDNQAVVDQWHDETPTKYTAEVQLTAGNHYVKMEYYQHGSSATAVMTYVPILGSVVWHGEYFDNASLQGSPAMSHDDTNISFAWGNSSPGPAISQPTNWSARWTARRNVASAGYYTITANADDGVRVWLDNNVVIDQWHDSSPTTYAAMVFLTAGPHDWRIEYYQHLGGASLHVQINPGAAEPSDTAQAGPTASDISVDTSSTDFVKGGRTDGWQSQPDGRGGTAFSTTNSTFAEDDSNWARWYAPLPHSGLWDVSMYVPTGLGTTRNARFWITHAGVDDLVSVNQTLYENQWVDLGTFYFGATGVEYVSLSNVTYEPSQSTAIVADAVRYSPR